jgi:hypothetical protein
MPVSILYRPIETKDASPAASCVSPFNIPFYRPNSATPIRYKAVAFRAENKTGRAKLARP